MGALLNPSLGTIFWSTIAFLVVLFLLRKMAWGPILKALDDREKSIEEALNAAEKARTEMASMQADNERSIQEARNERNRMMQEAREMADSIISDAKNKAKEEAGREVASAREAIELERKSAVAKLKAEVANLSIDIAEQIVRAELKEGSNQQELINKLIDESPLN